LKIHGPSYKKKYKIIMDVQEVGCGSMDWIDLAHDMERWWALVNTVMNLRAP
jgi:hypothetical protein